MPRTRMQKHTPGPWNVHYAQVDSQGRKGRPSVVNCYGDKLGRKPADAELMAAAPELVELVASLVDLAEMQALQIASALELPHPERPPIVGEARLLLGTLRTKGVDL